MKALYKLVEKIRPTFSEGGKLHAFHSVFDGFETFLFTPNTTQKRIGSQIHDANDSKRTMIMVVLALVPAMLFGMYNVGYQHFLATGQDAGFWATFAFGLLAVLPYIIVSYVVGLGIEFTVAQWKKEEIQEGFLVTGFLIPLIVPIDTPLWMVAIATAFAVIFAKEIFGGTGYNIFNVAIKSFTNLLQCFQRNRLITSQFCHGVCSDTCRFAQLSFIDFFIDHKLPQFIIRTSQRTNLRNHIITYDNDTTYQL